MYALGVCLHTGKEKEKKATTTKEKTKWDNAWKECKHLKIRPGDQTKAHVECRDETN